MGRNTSDMQGGSLLGAAVKAVARRRWPSNAAKMAERVWGYDARTARNVADEGKVSERSLGRAIEAEGWAFIEALGQELTGETYAEYLHRITERDANVQRERERHRDAVRSMETRARDLGYLLAGPEG